jgi:hypothetical protein
MSSNHGIKRRLRVSPVSRFNAESYYGKHWADLKACIDDLWDRMPRNCRSNLNALTGDQKLNKPIMRILVREKLFEECRHQSYQICPVDRDRIERFVFKRINENGIYLAYENMLSLFPSQSKQIYQQMVRELGLKRAQKEKLKIQGAPTRSEASLAMCAVA